MRLIYLGCLDYWGSYVFKDFPITRTLQYPYGKIYEKKDLWSLLQNTEAGELYTMVINISSNCTKDIEIGFSGDGGWFKTNIPANSDNKQVTVTDKWKPKEKLQNDDPRLESRMICGASYQFTIHQIKLFKGPVNCFSEDVKKSL